MLNLQEARSRHPNLFVYGPLVTSVLALVLSLVALMQNSELRGFAQSLITKTVALRSGQSTTVNCSGERLNVQKDSDSQATALCRSREGSTSSSPMPSASPRPSTTTSAAPSSSPRLPVPPPPPPPSGTGSIPFGPIHWPNSEFSSGPYTGTLETLVAGSAQLVLDAARANGKRMFVALAGAGGASLQKNDGSGKFDLSKFKAKLDAIKALETASGSTFSLQSYVDDGTVLGNLTVDEPQDAGSWGGAPIPYSDLLAAAAYSKQLWPNLPFGFASPPDWLVTQGSWIDSTGLKVLDLSFAQINVSKESEYGGIEGFISAQNAAADQLGIGLVYSINALNGGSNQAAITSTQLTTWGTRFASEPRSCALFMWSWESSTVDRDGDGVNFFAMSGISTAVNQILAVAASNPGSPCDY